ncbi:nitroreductase family protein [Paenibacillus rhizophilus]|uniref:Nitroreductase family protein n=1 Tax=Paenibacillus rhizophilus TaxID=1850366 RepID=A0A3N9P309_9BACL|nr:nitroreductase family protein [Paenibacillus rhizophilus]RQW09847.1 nitroreductase family protein [Paenibacillus rhizophilus]
METQVKNSLSFSQVIQERHSVRKYDSSRKMSDEEINDLLSDAVLAPSSSNLQPWRFIVITDQALKEQLLPIAHNQRQVVEASAIIAVLGDLEAYRNVDKIWDSAVEAGHATTEVRNMMVENSWNAYSALSREKQKEIALVDGGLISMQLMLAAKAKGYDTVPMGGYNADQFREMFQIPQRYATVMLIAVGHAEAAGRQTTRLPLEDVVQFNGFKG